MQQNLLFAIYVCTIHNFSAEIYVSKKLKIYDTWLEKTSLSKTHDLDENQQNKCKHLYL